jgi:hypothetical protein
MHIRLKSLAAAGVALALLAWGPMLSAAGIISTVDMSKPFGTRSAWQFTATQGPDVEDPTGDMGPGAIVPCLSNDKGRSCQPDLQRALHLTKSDDIFAEPHYLNNIEIVHPRADRALLLVQMASMLSGDGDQRVATQIFAYDRARDSFLLIYGHQTGRNNNQVVRYLADGRLKGAIIVAEPTENAPFGYWITVNQLTPAYAYKQVLRYRSATRYGDGNPLSVIDSEMPGIQQRLGLWRPGQPLPLPKAGCAKPRLTNMELWCG